MARSIHNCSDSTTTTSSTRIKSLPLVAKRPRILEATPQRRSQHHYTPQFYLRGWAEDGNSRVHAYQLLVPDERVPIWVRKHVRKVARIADLYTSAMSGDADDSFEVWMDRFVESPAARVLARLRAGESVHGDDVPTLVRLLAALDIRTPVAYRWFADHWERDMQPSLDKVMQAVPQQLQAMRRRPRERDELADERARGFPFRVRVMRDAEGAPESLNVGMVGGRELWLWHMRRLIERTATVLEAHSWAILLAPTGFAWFTSDHPVVKLNFHSWDKYDFGGGWNSPGTELFLPLSSRQLLYTHIGRKSPPIREATHDEVTMLQRIVAERAHRWIIASHPQNRPVWFRPRVVSKERFEAEARGWDEWHLSHSYAISQLMGR